MPESLVRLSLWKWLEPSVLCVLAAVRGGLPLGHLMAAATSAVRRRCRVGKSTPSSARFSPFTSSPLPTTRQQRVGARSDASEPARVRGGWTVQIVRGIAGSTWWAPWSGACGERVRSLTAWHVLSRRGEAGVGDGLQRRASRQASALGCAECLSLPCLQPGEKPSNGERLGGQAGETGTRVARRMGVRPLRFLSTGGRAGGAAPTGGRSLLGQEPAAPGASRRAAVRPEPMRDCGERVAERERGEPCDAEEATSRETRSTAEMVQPWFPIDLGPDRCAR